VPKESKSAYRFLGAKTEDSLRKLEGWIFGLEHPNGTQILSIGFESNGDRSSGVRHRTQREVVAPPWRDSGHLW